MCVFTNIKEFSKFQKILEPFSGGIPMNGLFSYNSSRTESTCLHHFQKQISDFEHSLNATGIILKLEFL